MIEEFVKKWSFKKTLNAQEDRVCKILEDALVQWLKTKSIEVDVSVDVR